MVYRFWDYEVFDDIFPVESFTGNLSLEFGDYSFESPRYSIKGCKERYELMQHL